MPRLWRPAFAGLRVHVAILLVGALIVAGLFLARRYADGPIGPIPGGPLRRGPLVSASENLAKAFGEASLAQLQLAEPPSSRTTGLLYHGGQVFIPCDQGFIWRRAPIPARWLMGIISYFKRWHEDAARDGRAIIRARGQRYPVHLVPVTQEALAAELRGGVEAGAVEFLGAPLAESPSGAPPDPAEIWFFRVDPPREVRH